MKYTLMHKEIPVITLEYNENALAFTDVLDIYNPACFPLGTMDPDKCQRRREIAGFCRFKVAGFMQKKYYSKPTAPTLQYSFIL